MVARRDGQRGAALFAVLVLCALMAGFAATASRTALSGARAAALFADLVRADELGRGAGDILADHLSRAGPPARRSGTIAASFPDAEVTIDYVSESARLDVNLAPIPLVAALLAAAGADPAEVDAVASRAARFRSEAARADGEPEAGGAEPNPPSRIPDGSPSDLPGRSARRSEAPQPAIRDTAEVPAAWGLSDALADRVLPVLTVSNGSARVDPTLADRLVLTALLGSDERADDYLARRAQGFPSADAAQDLVAVPARAWVSFNDAPAVRAVARVVLADRFERRYEMVLAPATARRTTGAARAEDAPVVVSWRKLL